MALTTIKGIYRESKAGPVVGGTVLINEEFKQEFDGKTVEATGEIDPNHEFKIKPYKKGEPVSQGFDMPIMRNVKSLKLVK